MLLSLLSLQTARTSPTVPKPFNLSQPKDKDALVKRIKQVCFTPSHAAKLHVLVSNRALCAWSCSCLLFFVCPCLHVCLSLSTSLCACACALPICRRCKRMKCTGAMDAGLLFHRRLRRQRAKRTNPAPQVRRAALCKSQPRNACNCRKASQPR